MHSLGERFQSVGLVSEDGNHVPLLEVENHDVMFLAFPCLPVPVARYSAWR